MSMLYCVAAISLESYLTSQPLLVHLHIRDRRVKREVYTTGLSVGIPYSKSFEGEDGAFVHSDDGNDVGVVEHLDDADGGALLMVRRRYRGCRGV